MRNTSSLIFRISPLTDQWCYNASYHDLSSNHLDGTIPKLFPTLASLEIPDLSKNKLTAQLPECWWCLQTSEFMDLSNNFLQGELPESVRHYSCSISAHGQQKSNKQFSFSSTRKKSPQLLALYLRGNRVTGNIPSWIGVWDGCPQLRILQLQLNTFQNITAF